MALLIKLTMHIKQKYLHLKGDVLFLRTEKMKTLHMLIFFKHTFFGDERSSVHSSSSPFYHLEHNPGGVITPLVSKSCIKGAVTMGCWQGPCGILLMLWGKK